MQPMPGAVSVQVAGTSYKYASIESRERLGRDTGDGAAALARAAHLLDADGCVLLRTCNRVEIYFIAPVDPANLARIREFFTWLAGSDGAVVPGEIYHYAGPEATRHLFDVACGLDSMILGEYEILGQVKAALAEALEAGLAGAALSRLFHQAVKTGKRARSETGISSGIYSVGQCAVRLAEQSLGDLHGKHVLLFGAGRIARAASKHLAVSCGTDVTVFSRTAARAAELAEHLHGRSIASDQLPDAFRSSDIVIGCASAPHHVIGVAELQEAMEARHGRPMVVVDLGVPRNVDPAVGALPDVYLFNLDDLESAVSDNAKAREAEVRKVRSIIDEELAAVLCPEAQQRMTDLIVQLRARAEELRQECLRRACGGNSAQVDAQLLDQTTDLLVRKLLHGPIFALREAARAANADDTQIAAMVARIFDLDEPNPSPTANGEDEQTSSRGTHLSVAQGRACE